MGKLTDFNDLHCALGLDAVREQIESNAFMPDSPAPSETCPDSPPDYLDIPLDAYAEDIESPSPSDGESLTNENGRLSINTLLRDFFYVWGTDTAWDNLERKQIRLSHLRHGVGRERYKSWDEAVSRKMVRDIKFSPGKDLGADYVNLYNGFHMEPNPRAKSGCKRILQHIWQLCGERDDEFEWLMNWIAYPLQHPGAKMASSVIMYGSEGPGKSVLWEKVVKKIYGDYAVTIGQQQLESQFTGWRSKKLFALAEEVVSRSERNHHKGALKQIVTGATHMINEKMLPEHEEGNHMNFVFLSNSTVPLELDMGDRRYLVLYTYKKPEKKYFDDLFEEINGGGVECFYQHLLDRKIENFSAHTEPPVNEEKNALIDSSLPAPIYFHKQWAAGELDIPYMSATAGDLFLFFKRWCDERNEFKRTDRYFGAEIKRVMRQVRTSIKYPKSNSDAKTKRIYVSKDELSDNDSFDNDVITKSCVKFYNLLHEVSSDQ